ncbi:hypothetical protein E2L00_16910 [Cedecea colo]|uniref:Uncharacterized protein n=1 Tax=Cedecea colo TaxID=2552946 RepID=A0ABX0VQ83_9ENTR|nr:hypothetical protein [Cedecea colo]
MVKSKKNLSANYIFDFDNYGFSDGYGTGPAREFSGNLDIATNFYPMVVINDLFNTQYVKLYGGNVKSKEWGRRYKVRDINEIKLEPIVHLDKSLALNSAKGKSTGMEITYPDGSVGPLNETEPDYDKLLSIK